MSFYLGIYRINFESDKLIFFMFNNLKHLMIMEKFADNELIEELTSRGYFVTDVSKDEKDKKDKAKEIRDERRPSKDKGGNHPE